MAGVEQHRFRALDALRGICACCVVFFHLQVTGGLAALPFFRNSWLLVDFFFVLSGFVIMASYGRRLAEGFSPVAFMALRLGRVYPVHLALIGAYASVELASLLLHLDVFTGRPAFTGSQSLSALLHHLTLTHIFGFQEATTWNGPSWSIAAEIWTYLIVAVGLLLLRVRFLLMMGGIVLMAPVVMSLAGDEGLDWTFNWSLVRCLYGFGIGMLAFELHRALGQRLTCRYATVLELVVGFAAVLAISLIGSGALAFALPPFFAIVILIFAREGGRLSQWLCTSVPQALGHWSYSIYMVHLFIITRSTDILKLAGQRMEVELVATHLPNGKPGKILVGSDLLQSIEALGILALVILAAALCYRLIEEPGRLLSRRWVKRWNMPSQVKGNIASSA